MNPFTDSTVARPLPKQHRDRRWRTPENKSQSSLQQPGHSTAANDSDIAPQEPDHHPDTPRPSCGVVTRLTRRSVSALATCGVGISLVLASAFGTVMSPFVMSSSAMLLGALTPRQVHAMDLNQASVQELQTLRGIGPKTAGMIVDERTRGGNYTSLSDLSDRVKGIGPKKAEALQAMGLKVTSGPGVKEGAAEASRQTSTSARR